MPQKIIEGETPLKGALQRIRQAEQDALDEQARLALEHIKSRTLRGIGINERRFANYTLSTYKKKKRFFPVTLRDKLNMIPSLYIRENTKKRREIVFRDRKEELKGRWHQFGTKHRTGRKAGTQRMAARRWFGLTLRFSRQSGNQFNTKISQVFERDRRKIFRITISK